MRPLPFKDVNPVLREAMPLTAERPPQRVAVLGGSGFIGARIVRGLAEAGFRVRCGVRRALPPREEGSAVDFVLCDSSNAGSLESLFEGQDAVVYAAGLTTASGHQSWNTYLRQNVESTLNVELACRKVGVKTLVYLGSQAAHEGAEGRYGVSKHLGEKIVEASSLDWVVLKPGQVIGQKGLVNTLFGLSALLPVFPVLGNTPRNLELVGVDEIAAFVMKVIRDPSGYTSQIIHLGSEERLSFSELLELLWERKKKRPPLVVHLPRWFFSIAVRSLRLVGIKVPLTAQVLDGIYTPLPSGGVSRRECNRKPSQVLADYL
jgi:nucleoside-diphosphate-sugar epimerase